MGRDLNVGVSRRLRGRRNKAGGSSRRSSKVEQTSNMAAGSGEAAPGQQDASRQLGCSRLNARLHHPGDLEQGIREGDRLCWVDRLLALLAPLLCQHGMPYLQGVHKG